MKKHIAEELPARKHAPAADAVNGGKKDKGDKSPESRVRQAVYDIRYRARREELSLPQAYSQYMQNSNMSQQEKALVKGKLFGKGPMKEDFHIEDYASTNVANALYKVFVEGVKQDEPIRLTYMEKMENAEDRKYKVRVTGKDRRSYVRYATREKINSLRSNPNIDSVEMTEYGEPYEGEKNKGELTTRAKRGDKLDPVGKEDADVNNDNKVDKTDKYLQHRRDVRGDAISKRKGVNEEFIDEIKTDPTSVEKDNKQIDVMKGSNKVVISPNIPGVSSNQTQSLQMAHHVMNGPFITEKATSQAQQKFMGMVLATKRGAKPMSSAVAQAAKGMTEKQARDFAKTKHKGLPVHKEESECGSESKLKKSESDVREIPTKMNLVKNKFRSMGLKMSYEPDGSTLEEGRDEDAQERRFQTRGHRSRGETATAAIGTAARAKDTLESRRKKVKPESPKGKELSSRSERMGERIKKLQQARQNDTSTFRQGRVGSPKPDN